MWGKLCFILTLTLLITVATSEDCCLCSDDSNSDKSGSMRDETKDVNDCPCRNRNSDSVRSSSILVPNTVHSHQSLIRRGDLKEEPKPLLHPEVGLASSILETIREVTDEEYKEALARDAARNLLKAAEPMFTDPIPEESGRMTVVVNPIEAFGSEEDTSHVQEARCIHSPLSARFNKLDHLKLIPKHPKLMKEFVGLPKVPKKLFHKSKSIFDMDVGASNLQERLVDGVTDGLEKLKLKTNPSLFNLFPEKTSHPLKTTLKKTENFQRKNVLENECTVTENDDNARSSDSNESNQGIFGSHLLPKLRLINQFHKSSEDEHDDNKPLLFKNLWKLRDVELIPPRRNNTRKNKIIPDLKARPLFLDKINERQNIFDNFKPIKIGDLFLNPTHQDPINNEGKNNANNKENICEVNNEEKSLNSNNQPSPNNHYETKILDTLPAASKNIEVPVQTEYQDVMPSASELLPLSSLFSENIKNDTPEPENYFEKIENSEENVEEIDTKVANPTPDHFSTAENENDEILNLDPKDNSDVHEESIHDLINNNDENDSTLMFKHESPDQVLSDTSSQVINNITNEFRNEENNNFTMDEMKRIQFCSSEIENFEYKEKINRQSDEKITDNENMSIEMKHQNETEIESYSSFENDDINLPTELNSPLRDQFDEGQFMNVNEEFIESTTLLPIGITKEANENSISYEDLQNMSDSLIKLEKKKFEDISKGSFENTTTVIVSDIDIEQTTTQNIIPLQSESIPISMNDIKSNETVTENSILNDLEITNITKTRSAEDTNEMSVSASDAVASLIRPLGRSGSNLHQKSIVEPLSIMGGSDSSLFNNPLIDGLNLPKLPTLDDITSSITNPRLVPDLSDILGSSGRQPILENLPSRILNRLQGTDVVKSSLSDHENLERKPLMSLDSSKSNPFDLRLPKNIKPKKVSSPLSPKSASHLNVNDGLLRNPTRAGLPFFSFSDTENTVRNLQETLKSTLEPRSNIFKLGDPLNVPSILKTVSKTHDSINDELQMFHNDFNDRLSAIHKSIFKQSQSRQNNYGPKKKELATHKRGKENRNPISSSNMKNILRNTPTNLNSPSPLILQSGNENRILNQLGLRHIKKEGLKVPPLKNRLKSIPKVPLLEKKVKISFSTTKRPFTTPVPKLGVLPYSRSNNRNNKHKLMPNHDFTGSPSELEGVQVPFSKRLDEINEFERKPRVNRPEKISEGSFISKSPIKIDRPFSQFGEAPTITSSRRQMSALARPPSFARDSQSDHESVEIGTGSKPSLTKVSKPKPIDMEIETKPRPSNNPDQSKQKSANSYTMFENSNFLSAVPREEKFARKIQKDKNVEPNSRSEKPTNLRPEDTFALRREKQDKTFNVTPLKHTIAWPKRTENSFLSKVREAMKARISNLNKSPKDSAGKQTTLSKEDVEEDIDSSMETPLNIDSEESVRSESNQGNVWPKFLSPVIKSSRDSREDLAATDSAEESKPVVKSSDRSEPIKETVSYKCKMLCTKE